MEQYCSEWLISCLEIAQQDSGKYVILIKGEMLSELLFRQYDRDDELREDLSGEGKKIDDESKKVIKTDFILDQA